ncbi:MAG: T9SS type A sorting domain-containing protein [Candidatus Marinimicrobia bacterium]|nr:T9SS type A sorting domain-containing protein [FCB group bacterium]MBL7026187.1 T9SS type A sorting domain-containing protein [Candidatus Neomarinimicrobiota bacterium]
MKKKDVLNGLILLSLSTLFSCYEIVSVDQPACIEPGSSFSVLLEVDSEHQIQEIGALAVMLPSGWSITDSILICFGGMIGSLYPAGESINAPPFERSGYQWHLFVGLDYLQHSNPDSLTYLNFNIQSTTVNPGLYITEYVIGVHNPGSMPSVQWYDQENCWNAQHVWVDMDLPPINNNIFVDPDGFDGNDGLTPATALRTILAAIFRINADSLNPRTITLADGEYSPSTNGDFFPVRMKAYVSVIGVSEEGVTLNPESNLGVFEITGVQNVSLESMTITNTNATDYLTDALIRVESADPSITNISMTGALASPIAWIYCQNASPTLTNLTFSENNSWASYGFIYIENAAGIGPVELANIRIINNYSNWCTGLSILGGEVSVNNLVITGNQGITGIGVWGGTGHIYIDSSTIAGNNKSVQYPQYSAGILIESGLYQMHINNSIIWNDSIPEINILGNESDSTIVYSAYSDIQGGQDSIYIGTDANANIQWLEGNIDADPLFCHPTGGDFHLAENSPCAGAGEDGVNMGAFDVGCTVGLKNDSHNPNHYALHQNYPNPFNPTTNINYSLPEHSAVKLAVFNILGQELMTLLNEVQQAGNYKVQWSGLDKSGTPASTGVYFCRLEAGDYRQTIKMIYLP